MNLDSGSIKQFVLAGKSTFTIQNTETGKHFTYNVKSAESETGKTTLWFVSLLTGADIYSYIGIITSTGFKTTKKTKVSDDSIGLKGFKWLWSCGRKLTTPQSIDTGFGPVCSGKL